ncbi:peptidoglycan-binding domain-containing protein [Paraburkholderia acidiphila]|uniref:Protein with peptidoglycan-binding domain protein n=1 Tax=Paraburkholderia acidiphila TaxID=2571747 RepID=A0A7Z2GD70_9BURK|nr:peptidoglycan-binding domain-containing protein [Paraburkholderia acidiphila]QGZ59365.1 protein with peptidoglycan-binding domain protein [Paraburkholderia acidiphila]
MGDAEGGSVTPDKYPVAVYDELAYPGALSTGSKGPGVKRVQEWLCYHGFGTAIDSDFGSATAAALANFQQHNLLQSNSTLDAGTWKALVDPIRRVMADGTGNQLDQRISTVASNHLAMHPREFGGDNCGPWVRIYTGGRDGVQWKWCAGFVTFLLKQACVELAMAPPVPGSLSCDSLAAQAKAANRFRTSESVANSWPTLGQTYIFLVRNGAGDWMHTGLGFAGAPRAFSTIEGNTNDDGSQNGYEVCARTRAAAGKDFIYLL